MFNGAQAWLSQAQAKVCRSLGAKQPASLHLERPQRHAVEHMQGQGTQGRARGGAQAAPWTACFASCTSSYTRLSRATSSWCVMRPENGDAVPCHGTSLFVGLKIAAAASAR